MAIVAGIDEAGFGPLLGPLTVAAAVFHAPDSLAEEDFWTLLSPQVSARAAKRSGAVAIADSKKLFKHEPGGLANLERAVLGSLSILPENAMEPPYRFTDLLERICPGSAGKLTPYPWYAGQDPTLPRDADPTDIRLRAKGMRDALDRRSMEVLGLRARMLNVVEYNDNVIHTDNKAVTLTDQTFWLLDWVWRNRPAGQRVIVYVDRQGGRQKYLPALQRIYPDHRRAQVLSETAEHSGYRLVFEDGELEAHFLKKGETHKLPIALASMTAKYLRELCMGLFNRWWADQTGEGYTPTAGYYTDAMRFLKETQALRRRLAIDDALLIRSR